MLVLQNVVSFMFLLDVLVLFLLFMFSCFRHEGRVRKIPFSTVILYGSLQWSRNKDCTISRTFCPSCFNCSYVITTGSSGHGIESAVGALDPLSA